MCVRWFAAQVSAVAWVSMIMSAMLGLLALTVVFSTFYIMRSWSLWLTGVVSGDVHMVLHAHNHHVLLIAAVASVNGVCIVTLKIEMFASSGTIGSSKVRECLKADPSEIDHRKMSGSCVSEVVQCAKDACSDTILDMLARLTRRQQFAALSLVCDLKGVLCTCHVMQTSANGTRGGAPAMVTAVSARPGASDGGLPAHVLRALPVLVYDSARECDGDE